MVPLQFYGTFTISPSHLSLKAGCILEKLNWARIYNEVCKCMTYSKCPEVLAIFMNLSKNEILEAKSCPAFSLNSTPPSPHLIWFYISSPFQNQCQISSIKEEGYVALSLLVIILVTERFFLTYLFLHFWNVKAN